MDMIYGEKVMLAINVMLFKLWLADNKFIQVLYSNRSRGCTAF